MRNLSPPRDSIITFEKISFKQEYGFCKIVNFEYLLLKFYYNSHVIWRCIFNACATIVYLQASEFSITFEFEETFLIFTRHRMDATKEYAFLWQTAESVCIQDPHCLIRKTKRTSRWLYFLKQRHCRDIGSMRVLPRHKKILKKKHTKLLEKISGR